MKGSGSVALGRDVTEQKRLERELRATHDQLEFLVSYGPVVIYTCEPYGSCATTFVSKNVASELGYTAEEFTKDSKFWVNHLHPGDKQRVLDGLASLRKQGHHIHEYRFQHRDGTYRRVRDELKLIRDESGIPVEVIGYMIDITKRDLIDGGRRKYGMSVWKRAEHLEDVVEARTSDLAESERKYHLLVGNMADGVFTIDLVGNLTFCTPQTAKMTGYAVQQLLSMNIKELIAPEDLLPVLRRLDVRRRGETDLSPIQFEIVRADGTRLPIEIHTTLLLEGNKPAGVQGIARDITERKRMEAQLTESQRLAAIGETATMVGHDLRNPLQGIMGAVEVLKLELGPVTNKIISEMLDVLKNNVEYASKIVSDLQDYARPVHINAVEVCTDDLIRNTLSTIQIPKTIQASVAIAADLEKITVDPMLIKRVFTNLIINAIQAMPDGGKVMIRASKQQEAAIFSIEDTGAGISEENMDKLFEAFFTTKAQGQGLGLPVCKRLIEAHGGTITAKSQLAKGSTFTIIIPHTKNPLN